MPIQPPNPPYMRRDLLSNKDKGSLQSSKEKDKKSLHSLGRKESVLPEEKEQRKTVKGKSIFYTSDVRKGMEHLHHTLDKKEVEPFLREAYLKGQSHFENRKGENFTVLYDRVRKAYKIVKRDPGR